MSLSFGHPWVLSLLAVPLLLLALVWSGRGGRLPLPFDGTARPDRRSRGVGLAVLLRLAESVSPLLLAVAVILWPGPRRSARPPPSAGSPTSSSAWTCPAP